MVALPRLFYPKNFLTMKLLPLLLLPLLAGALVQPAAAAPKKDKAAKPAKAVKVDENATPFERAVDVFVPKDGNPYASIRIPTVVKAGGMIVALAEGRYQNTDQGQNDLIVSLSKDGKKWSKPEVAARSEGATFNNPCIIYDAEAKQLCLFFQRYPQGVKERDKNIPTGWEDDRCIRNFVCFSKNGKAWSKPKDVTKTTKNEGVTITCSGPNPGCQLTRGSHKGRLIVPLNEGPFGDWTLAAAYSDDHGKTWKIGQKSAKGGGVNEVSVAETDAGGLLIVSRAWGGGNRKVARSEDGGETWGEISAHGELPSPNCQNGLLRYSFADDAKLGGRSRILFSSPTAGRTNGIIKMSYDDGQTWEVEKHIGDGSFAYSALCHVKPGVAGLLFETDGRIKFTTIPLSWLTDGADKGVGDKEKEKK